MKRITGSIIVLISLSLSVMSQTGGQFDLSHSVIAGGGGSASTGGNFTLDGTSGQPLAGAVSVGGSFVLRGGFWASNFNVPTSASVTVSGMVMSISGDRISGARVTLTHQNGDTRSVLTTPFGYYSFDAVSVGETYVLTVSHKRYLFTPQILTVMEEISNLNFTADN